MVEVRVQHACSETNSPTRIVKQQAEHLLLAQTSGATVCADVAVAFRISWHDKKVVGTLEVKTLQICVSFAVLALPSLHISPLACAIDPNSGRANEAAETDPIGKLFSGPPRENASDDPAEPRPHLDRPPTDGSADGGFVEPRPGDRPPQRGGWYLGVYGHYSPTGLLLTQVYPNTAAARAGLEVGDRIVAVNGHQIGDVLNRRIAIDSALQTSRSGRVRLLVQDRRTHRLVNLDVQLTRGRLHT
tara:strand:+ start:21410 stop:22144 length:735 start_codon:yes stop_codon:yes gene_type:complete